MSPSGGNIYEIHIASRTKLEALPWDSRVQGYRTQERTEHGQVTLKRAKQPWRTIILLV